MKKIIVIATIGVFFTRYCLSQNFSITEIKEQYERLLRDKNYNVLGYRYAGNNNNIANDNGLGEDMSYVLESWLNMYETTRDKAYLLHFINEAIRIMEVRGNYMPYIFMHCDVNGNCATCGGCEINNTYNHVFSWSDNMENNGLILWSLSHFVYFVKKVEPALESVTLYQTGKISNNLWGVTFNTYGEFADWLRDRIVQSIDYFNAHFWISDDEGYGAKYGDNTSTLVINMQSPFGAALFYIGATDPSCTSFSCSNDYLHKAAAMASLYHGSREKTCPDNFLNSCDLQKSTTQEPVLEFLNNTWVWLDLGWQDVDCKSCKQINDGNPISGYYMEDISHGVVVLIFPQVIHNKLSSNGTMLIDDYDMIFWHNTFTNNIFHNYTGDCPHFHNNVAGGETIILHDAVGNDYAGEPPEDYYKFRALSYMPFYKFDIGGSVSSSYISSTNVYDVVKDFYISSCFDATATAITSVMDGFGPLDLRGLSEVAAAQWDKDCPNLTLYSRDVVYAQDFFAKNELTIAPRQSDDFYTAGTDEPFAEPKTFTDGGATDRFVIEPGITVNLIAGKRMVGKAGFHAKAGSHVHAYLDPSLYDCNQRLGNTVNNEKDTTRRAGNYEIINNSQQPDTNAAVSVIDVKTGSQNVKKEKQNGIAPSPNFNAQSINITPNPTTGKFSLRFVPIAIGSSWQNTNASIEITDVLGRVVFVKNNFAPDIANPIDLSHLQKGIYFLKISMEDEMRVEKIVIE